MVLNTTLAPHARIPGKCHDSDQAWMLMATVLVLGMFPGVAFFEAGLLRHKNTTTILAQVFCGLAMLSVMWFCVGYSLTFSRTATNGFIGDFNNAFFINIDSMTCEDGRSVATMLYAVFQLMFACITPLLMTGAYAERLAWVPFVIFTLAWEVLVYYPVAHWLWSPAGWLAKMGGLDFAGGIVIHTTAGVSSLVVVAMLGRRKKFDQFHGSFPYSSLPHAAVGATLLWTGWFGFNGGSALASNANAIVAVTNSQIGAVFAACSYMLVIMWMTRTPSTIAIMNGAIAGLAGITPASGYITPQAAMVLGVILGLSVEPAVHLLRHKMRLDDALDVSVVHGLTGIIGSIYIGLCATKSINPGIEDEGALYSRSGYLFGVQVLAVVVCGAWAAFWSAAILLVVRRFTPLRVSEEHEHAGLDISIFRERSHHYDPEPASSFHEALLNATNSSPGPLPQAVVNQAAEVVAGSLRSSFAGPQVLTHRGPQDTPLHDPLRPEEENSAEQLLRDIRASFVAHSQAAMHQSTEHGLSSSHPHAGLDSHPHHA